jgi:hypothetical protein
LALVWHLKPDEMLRLAGRRVALSVGRDGRIPPLVAPRFNADGTHIEVEASNLSIQAPPKPVFVVVELRPDEPLRVDGAVIRWNTIRRRQHGMGPALVIDAPKATHPVDSCPDRYDLRRADFIGGLP